MADQDPINQIINQLIADDVLDKISGICFGATRDGLHRFAALVAEHIASMAPAAWVHPETGAVMHAEIFAAWSQAGGSRLPGAPLPYTYRPLVSADAIRAAFAEPAAAGDPQYPTTQRGMTFGWHSPDAADHFVRGVPFSAVNPGVRLIDPGTYKVAEIPADRLTGNHVIVDPSEFKEPTGD